MNIHVYLSILVIYFLGFLGMYFYSLKRDDECGLERNPREAFVFGLLWVVITPILFFWIVIEKIIRLVRATYNRNKKNG
ncbi:hypothetical protein I9Y19_004813 [Citrobacter freundii]|uniref:DUF3302 domain-containing protein n=1 Tax=Citrobacter freundii TaxID=546 RepID=A0ABY7LB60_CITFR|nr:hypothetical protein [Citrobacter freundii]EBZ5074297.1 hypothetical protein [Salmonella enterica subsp. enterica serovar Typhimurium]EEB8458242.1 hypothetical protein [Salmonella enterica]ECL7522381.1 hypothetical protein [Salmonella enterica subsp. enterica serovar Typhimurium]EDN3714083.1 hypothetical protein [Salmonella enterica subsp. enterica serovar Typhimurium]EEF6236510.1 hypothetical protein [Salmonella enterica]